MEESLKQLLLTDLCARLPYGLKVQYANQACKLVTINDDYTTLLLGEDGYKPNIEDDLFLDIENIKPYLRPLSSMTEEEKEELNCLCYHNISVQDERICGYICADEMYDVIDWLNKNMFDYLGLIGKGLALKASRDMYKLKTE